MDEIMKIKEVNFQNENLQNATNQINALGNEMAHNVRSIARILADVATSECYKEDGFKNCVDYAMETFGFKKSFAYNLIAIGKRFSEANTALADYSATQLIKMLPMSDEELETAMESGDINKDMSAREIEEAVKTAKPKKTKDRAKKQYRFVDMVEVGTCIIDSEENFIARAFGDYPNNKVKVGERTLYVGLDDSIVIVWERMEEVKEVEEVEEKENK